MLNKVTRERKARRRCTTTLVQHARPRALRNTPQVLGRAIWSHNTGTAFFSFSARSIARRAELCILADDSPRNHGIRHCCRFHSGWKREYKCSKARAETYPLRSLPPRANGLTYHERIGWRGCVRCGGVFERAPLPSKDFSNTSNESRKHDSGGLEGVWVFVKCSS